MRTPLRFAALRARVSSFINQTKILSAIALILTGAGEANAQYLNVNTNAGVIDWQYEQGYSVWEVSLYYGEGGHSDGFDNALMAEAWGENISTFNEYHFSSALGVAIQHFAVTNIGTTPTTFGFMSYGNLGSDGSTTWHYTSNANTKYTISSDQFDPNWTGSDPVISMFYGTGALNAYNPQLTFNNYSDHMQFQVDGIPLAPGETRRFLILAGVGNIDDNSGNTPAAAFQALQPLMDPNNWPEDFTSFLTPAQKAEVMNWGPISTLPVTMKDFTASLADTKVNLRWSTANEQNTKDFAIQHSKDGSTWTVIGSVAAAGNSNTERHYAFTHHTPSNGVNYYRLKQGDLDGRSTVSAVRTVRTSGTEKKLEVKGNPVSNGTMVAWVAEKGFATLVNLSGKTVWQGKLAQGLNQVSVSHLAAGTYFLRVNSSSAQVIISK